MDSNRSSGSAEAQAQACHHWSIFKDHPNHTHVMTWSPAQFCSAFFHVPEVDFKEVTVEECLDKDKCIIGKDQRKNSQPRYVTAFVVLKEGKTISYLATYGNCCAINNDTKHAEEFFDDDARKGGLWKKLEDLFTSGFGNLKVDPDQPKKSSNESLNMNMYITLQPCHLSVDYPDKKSCTETLIALYKKHFKPLKIKFVVKPTFIYKAYWKMESIEKVVKDAEAVLTKLRKRGIDTKAMTSEDWDTLKKITTLSVLRFAVKQAREKNDLDAFIPDVKAHWERGKKEIENAKEGLRQLQEAGIDIQKMKKEDWIFLKDHLCPSANICCDEKPYEGSQRKKLDDFIQTVIDTNKASSRGKGGASGGGGGGEFEPGASGGGGGGEFEPGASGGGEPEAIGRGEPGASDRDERGASGGGLAKHLIKHPSSNSRNTTLKWLSSVEELKVFLSENLNFETVEQKTEDAKTKLGGNGFCFTWYHKNKTLLCQGTPSQEDINIEADQETLIETTTRTSQSTTKKSRKAPHCKTCKEPMQGHSKAECRKAP